MNNAELCESLKDELTRWPASREIEVTFTRDELVHIVSLLAKAAAGTLQPEDGLLKDAERYRWLKANHLQTGPDSWIRTGDDLEEAIDAGMREASKPHGERP